MAKLCQACEAPHDEQGVLCHLCEVAYHFVSDEMTIDDFVRESRASGAYWETTYYADPLSAADAIIDAIKEDTSE